VLHIIGDLPLQRRDIAFATITVDERVLVSDDVRRAING